MKRITTKIICAAAISCTLLCSACGQQNKNEADSTANTTDENLITDSSDDSTVISSEDNDTNVNIQPDSSPANPADNDTDSAASPATITIETETVEDSDTAEDGTVIYTTSYTKPTVTIEGNAAASEKINSDIQARINSYTADNTLRNEAREYYEISSSEEDYYFNEYSETWGFNAVRSDTNVISFIISFYSYSGGAHGNYGSLGINYDARTGELIDFSELTENSYNFYNATLAYNQELALTDEYKERMFTSEFINDGELENVLYADEKWYLSQEGLVFISNPYELGPYAAGLIEFVIPYEELRGMGLKEEYDILE